MTLSLRARHVAELTAELHALLQGAQLREVQALPPRDVLLVFDPPPRLEDPPPVLRVRVSANPDAARLHLEEARVSAHRGGTAPFFAQLAKELGGATLRGIEQVGGDRIALFEFKDTPAGQRRALLAELTGRHANLLLLGRDDVVLGLLVEPPRRKSAPRLVQGQPWGPPGGRARPPEEDTAGILETFPAPELPPSGREPRAPLSWAVSSHLGEHAQRTHEDSERRRVAARLARRAKSARAMVRGLERRRAASREAERVRMDGELLKAVQHELSRGMKVVVVQDWFTPDSPDRELSLDPKLTPAENIERVFARYRKLVRSAEHADDEVAAAEVRASAIEAMAARLEAGEDALELEDEAVAAGLIDPPQVADPRKRKAPAARKPYRVFRAGRGSEVWVGRTARDNDTLTMRLARGNDLWLHTADCPGSHVVLRTEKGAEADQEEILDAAHLAIHFSPLRGTDRADVHLAHRKHVSKPRGAKPGLVQVAGGRILQIRVQPARTEALLRQAPAPEPEGGAD